MRLSRGCYPNPIDLALACGIVTTALLVFTVSVIYHEVRFKIVKASR